MNNCNLSALCFAGMTNRAGYRSQALLLFVLTFGITEAPGQHASDNDKNLPHLHSLIEAEDLSNDLPRNPEYMYALGTMTAWILLR